MTGPGALDQFAFTAWLTALYAVVALPIYGAWRATHRSAQ